MTAIPATLLAQPPKHGGVLTLTQREELPQALSIRETGLRGGRQGWLHRRHLMTLGTRGPGGGYGLKYGLTRPR
jgi:hypothetical protein